jgi:hypothetical protein
MYIGGGCLRSDTYDHTFNVIGGRAEIFWQRAVGVELIVIDAYPD